PTAIFSLLHLGANDTNWLTAFRKYPGIIRKKNILELRCNLEAEFIKKQISELSKKKGTEIIVNDYCENSDLDIWIQMLDINNAVISYFPQSLCIPENKFIELAFTSFYEKTPNMR
ncbi:MAG: hypothetical protein MUF15_02870, partial [Acidobacteria bacterium]|nr:hypothetical protein [Acidobacteriota bacterium]